MPFEVCQTKMCRECLRVLPLDHFPFRTAAGPARQGRCRQCYNAYMRRYRSARQSAEIERFTKQVKNEGNQDQVTALAVAMVNKFGGAARFAEAWKAHLDAAPPGTMMRHQGFLAILRLLS